MSDKKSRIGNFLELHKQSFSHMYQNNNGVDQVYIPTSPSANYEWVDYSTYKHELIIRSTMTDLKHLELQGSNSIYFEKVIEKSFEEKKIDDGEFYKADMVLEIPVSKTETKIKYIMENAIMYGKTPKKIKAKNLFYEKLAQAINYAVADNSIDRLMKKVFVGVFLTVPEIYYSNDLKQHTYINSPKDLDWFDALIDNGILSGVYLLSNEELLDIKTQYGYSVDSDGNTVRKKITADDVIQYSEENGSIFDINTNETFMIYDRKSGGYIKNNLKYVDLDSSNIELDYVSMPEKMVKDNTYKVANRAQKKGGGESDNIRPEYLENIKDDVGKFTKSIIEVLDIHGWDNYATTSTNKVSVDIAKTSGMEKLMHAWAPVTTVDIEYLDDGENIHTCSTDMSLANGQTSLGTYISMKDTARSSISLSVMKDFLKDDCGINRTFDNSKLDILRKIFINHTPIFRLATFDNKDIMSISNRNTQDVRALKQFDKSTLASKHMMVYLSYALNHYSKLPENYYLVNNISNLESRKFLTKPNKRINKQVGDIATTSRPYLKMVNISKIIDSNTFSSDVEEITKVRDDVKNPRITRTDFDVETLVIGLNFFRNAKLKQKHYQGLEDFYFDFTTDIVPTRIKKSFLNTLKDISERYSSPSRQYNAWKQFYNKLIQEHKENKTIYDFNQIIETLTMMMKKPLTQEEMSIQIGKVVKNSSVKVDTPRLAKFLDFDVYIGDELGIGNDRDKKPKSMPIGAPSALLGLVDYMQGSDVINDNNKKTKIEWAINELKRRIKVLGIGLDSFGNDVTMENLNDHSIGKIKKFFEGILDISKPISEQMKTTVSAQAGKINPIKNSQTEDIK